MFLLDALKYFKNKPHQVVAWENLESSLTKKQLAAFKEDFRNAPEPLTNESGYYAEHPITQKLLNRILELNIELTKPPKGYFAYVVGVSGVNTDLTPNGNQLDKWNDALCALRVYPDGKVQVIGMYRGTTEIGRHYTVNPMNNLGGARWIKDEVQETIWQVGKHRNQSNCLVQWAGDITVKRDSNRNGVAEANEPTSTGKFGINLHTTGSFVWNSIGRWSAGCWVLPLTKDKDAIVNICRGAVNNTFSAIYLDGNKL